MPTSSSETENYLATKIRVWTVRKLWSSFWSRWLLSLPYLFGITALLCFIVWIFPVSSHWIGWIWGTSLLATFLFAGKVSLSVPRRESVLTDVDRNLGTDDLALTVADPQIGGSWKTLLGDQLSPKISSIHPNRIWPIRWTPLRRVWLIACVLMGANLFLTASALRPPPSPIQTLSSEAVEQFRDMMEDWEDLAEESDEFEQLLKEMKALTKEVDLENQTAADQMELLSDMESAIEEKQEALDKDSIDEYASQLAALLETIAGMSPAAAALRRGDFAKAAELMEQQAMQAAAQGILPEGAEGADFRNLARALAQAAANDQQALSDALKKLLEASRTSDPSKWSNACQNLSSIMQQAGQRELTEAMLQQLLSQLEGHRAMLAGMTGEEGMGKAMGAGMGPGGKEPGGQGAGTEPGGDPLAEEETEPEGERDILRVEGTPAADGETSIRTIRASSAPPEAKRAERESSFAEYQELSTEAVSDESLPLIHRETIRKYFETIRPRDLPDQRQE